MARKLKLGSVYLHTVYNQYKLYIMEYTCIQRNGSVKSYRNKTALFDRQADF